VWPLLAGFGFQLAEAVDFLQEPVVADFLHKCMENKNVHLDMVRSYSLLQ